jgi:Nucleotidyl transferase AbiEii toxin, Type IV TA system
MFKDFIDLIALLNKHKAKYLVIGGYAVGYHAQARATKDLDILILPAPKNAQAVFNALQEFGAPLRTKADPQGTDRFAACRALSPKDFEDEDSWFMMGTPPIAVDILAKIPGVAFNAAWKNRVTVKLDEQQGITAHVISRDDLIAAKLASGRPQDLVDVKAIRTAAAEVSATKPAKPKSPKAKAKRKKPQPKT